MPTLEDHVAHIVHRGQSAYVILNRFPYNNGHLMIVPFVHGPSLDALDPPASAELMTLSRLGLQVLRQAYGPDGYNLGMNIGEAEGGDARWSGRP